MENLRPALVVFKPVPIALEDEAILDVDLEIQDNLLEVDCQIIIA